ncbi:MAG: phosphonopyruvate decarboxylase [Bacteroidaceae bacterium]|nr:phosphonopyruvate decarboxylase [Bacteroidaceae bacterium]MBR4779675.1 phosphonopyruvate decarboxylase [Bacteroidaceae bacterium]
MISPKYFIETLGANGIDFYAGVPDSLLKQVCAYMADHVDNHHYIIAANEGGAVGLAAGYHLATGRIGMVFMQNSGEGNAINPLASLTDKDVYNIPVLLLIGWRGEPGVHDEPQHVKQGKVTLPLLDVMGIHHALLSKDEAEAAQQVKDAVRYMTETNEPFALVVEKDTFSPYTLQQPKESSLMLSREKAVQMVAAAVGKDDVIVSTTGMISRELFEYRAAQGQSHEQDFLTVGSMGHASQIALGIALARPDRTVWCFDGDGAVLMHFGAMPIVGSLAPKNLVHVVFNNGAHDSVGGQPTVGLDLEFLELAEVFGYHMANSVSTEEHLADVLEYLPQWIAKKDGPYFLEIRVKKGNRSDLGRPTTTPLENKQAFMDFLKATK